MEAHERPRGSFAVCAALVAAPACRLPAALLFVVIPNLARCLCGIAVRDLLLVLVGATLPAACPPLCFSLSSRT